MDNFNIGRVAEVRPMRPSYSDVLAKSILKNNIKQNQTNSTNQDVKQKSVNDKTKSKFSVGRTLSGNANILNRQTSPVTDDGNYGNNSNLKNSYMKKMNCGNNKQEKKREVTQTTNGNSKNSNVKSQMAKKQEKSHGKVQMGVSENEFVSASKYGILRNKVPEEKKVPWPTRKAKSETQKTTKRNIRTCQPEKQHRKSFRNKRREQEPCLSTLIKVRMDRYGGVLLFALNWLLRLVLDVLGLSTHLAIHMCAAVWASSVHNASQFYKKSCHAVRNIEIIKRIINSPFYPFKKSDSKKKKLYDSDSDSDDSGEAKIKRKVPRGLKHNITLPVTGEEAMRRLLACKGKDPYSILGVTRNCTDDDIKKYYKRQAFLVHPDKNNQPGAEEAFKILVHAFDIIGEPEHRKSYDRRIEKPQSEHAAWSELSDLLSQLHKKMEYVANTIRCTNCNKRHKRTTVDRPIYAARMCNQCKIHHSVREGDIWAETSMFGLLWHYYACMDGAVYDITEWAGCQGSNLRNIKANTHNVQYRIVLGKQHGQKQNYQQPTPARYKR
ncbi:conserved hypothetical protein [Pediculus humanus corporis]|uniref:J domain-containing protein n=1 Tax=Pediculus humanus subsp. corporis TaxID=121224 RepID=E0VX40_PEDHC|nr:uncharacterized protein Phum_PHUM494550 [Pediculus humanus corporis]EEB17946.1 conserved hypothetical protein [Pediculus humanus corporis]